MSAMVPNKPKVDVLADIEKKINKGETVGAIADLQSLLDRGVRAPAVHRLLAFALLKNGKSEQALSELARARSLRLDTGSEDIALGRMFNQQGYFDAALDCFAYAASVAPENDDALALMCMAYDRLGQTDKAIEWGQRCLIARDQQTANISANPIGQGRPSPFDPDRRGQNIIAFSLFGDDEYYWDGAITAAAMGNAIYPEWTCRFYCDPGIPVSVLDCLRQRRAQVLLSPKPSENWSGLFWRFWAFDDSDVTVVMIRDVDAPFTVRERLAVDEWIASDYPFHVIRDNISHTEPVMAGLWGGWAGLLPKMYPMAQSYWSRPHNRFADQQFLRRHIWPLIRDAALVHDRYYRLGNTRPIPEHPTAAYSHIGGAWPRGQGHNRLHTM